MQKNVTKERPQKVKSSGEVHPVLAIVIQKFIDLTQLPRHPACFKLRPFIRFIHS